MGKTILIIVIVIVLIAVTGVGAYAMGNRAGFQQANATRQQFFQGRQTTGTQSQQGGAFGGGTGGGAAGNFAGRGIQGTIKSINGDTLVITIGTRDVTVTLDGKTQFEKTASASKSDLAAGARVIVTAGQPTTGADGSGDTDTITATGILIMPSQ